MIPSYPYSNIQQTTQQSSLNPSTNTGYQSFVSNPVVQKGNQNLINLGYGSSQAVPNLSNQNIVSQVPFQSNIPPTSSSSQSYSSYQTYPSYQAYTAPSTQYNYVPQVNSNNGYYGVINLGALPTSSYTAQTYPTSSSYPVSTQQSYQQPSNGQQASYIPQQAQYQSNPYQQTSNQRPTTQVPVIQPLTPSLVTSQQSYPSVQQTTQQNLRTNTAADATYQNLGFAQNQYQNIGVQNTYVPTQSGYVNVVQSGQNAYQNPYQQSNMNLFKSLLGRG